MYQVLVELSMSFVQYFAIIQSVDVSFPDSWADPVRYLRVVNLNFDFLRQFLPGFEDVRMFFFIVCVLLPLVIFFLGLLFLNTKRVVLWYFLLVVGIMLIAAGAFARIISATTDFQISNSLAERLIYVGGGLTAVCFVLYHLRTRVACLRPTESIASERKQIIEEETRQLDLLSTLQRFFVLFVLTVFGLLAAGFTPFKWLNEALDSKVGPQFGLGIGIAALVLALFVFIWFVMGLSVGGRKLQWEVGHGAESMFLRLLLLTMSLVYIPVGSGIFLIFNCNPFDCGAGYRLGDQGSWLFYNKTTAELREGRRIEWCAPCYRADFSTQRCSARAHAALCARQTDERLEYNFRARCEGMQTFFYPAAALSVIMFVIGVPVIFYRLITTSARMLDESFPSSLRDVAPPLAVATGADGTTQAATATPEEEEETWNRKVGQSRNVAKFLYQPFEQRFRYVRLFQLIQKLLIVAATVYVYRRSGVRPEYVALFAGFAIHLAATALLLRYRPFISNFEDKISWVMSGALTLDCLVGVLLLFSVDIPPWLMIVLIVLNGVLPLAALLIGIFLEWSQGKKSEEEEEKEKRERLKAELLRREQEEMAAAAGTRDSASPALAVEAAGDLAQPHQPQPPRPPAPQLPSQPQPQRQLSHQQLSQQMHTQQQQQLALAARGSLVVGTTVNLAAAERQRQRAIDAQLAVEATYEEDLKELAERQGDVDLQIDRSVKAQLNYFLMFAGLLGFLALGCCVVGLEVKTNSGSVTPADSQGTIEKELAGYATWDLFTANCCCAYAENDLAAMRRARASSDAAWGSGPQKDAAAGWLEKWVCGNGRIKERLRSWQSGTVNSTAVRGLCAATFNNGCSVRVGADRSVTLVCPSTVPADAQLRW